MTNSLSLYFILIYILFLYFILDQILFDFLFYFYLPALKVNKLVTLIDRHFNSTI